MPRALAPRVVLLSLVTRLVFPLVSSLVASQARAETTVTAPAGGGLPPLAVHVDLAAASVQAGDQKLPITLDRAQLPGDGDVTVEAIPIGQGRRIVHVRVPAKDAEGLAWEALLAAGQPQPLFAGVTGLTQGDPGERTGKIVRVLPSTDRSFVLVGDVREDLHLCGQDVTLLDPQAVYPASLDLRPATVQRLDPEQLAGARSIVASDKGPRADPALARLLVARGSSVPDSRGAELTDGDPATVWREARPGLGQGEFVVMAAPHDVPITRVQLVLSPPAADAAKDRQGAAPRTLYLVTGTETFLVTLPGDAWLEPGEAYEVVFPKPVEASCLSLVLSDAYTRAIAHPEVGVAELVAYSEFDAPGATLDDVAKQLSGPRGIAAAQLLERAGAPALAAAEHAYGGLDARGRALAVDVAASHDPCEESAPLLVQGLCEATVEAPRKAHEKLDRCRKAVPVLSARLRQDAGSRVCIAPTLAALAGADALEPLADAIAATPLTEPGTRAVLRAAFSQALEGAEGARLSSLLSDTKRSAQARLELMRASGPRVAEAAAPGEATLTEVFGASPTMRDRYVAMGPLGDLARAGDTAAARRIADTLAHDADWPVRVRAAEVATGVPDAQTALLAAAHDAEPRVREAALQSMAAFLIPGAIDAARARLADDSWSFVKVQAIGVLGRAQPSDEVDRFIAGSLQDASPRVRGSAVVALGRRRAAPLHEAVRQRLDDANEDPEVRAAAARVLGAMCDRTSADRLTELARRLGVPGITEDEQPIALGALEGLAAMQPPDLAERLAPLRTQTALPSVSNAAKRALEARGVCR
jgi:hypothetical protein